MNKYIFITAEGSTYQPNSENPEPDIENVQVIGFGQGNKSREALRKFIEENDYITDTSFDDIYAIRLANNKREYLSLKDIFQRH